MFEAWYLSRERSVFARRLDTYGHRLMVLLAATKGKPTVDVEVMTAVLALLRYQLEARRQADPVDADSTVARAETGIRRKLARGAVSERDLKDAIHVERVGLWVWETAITNLIRAGEVFFADKKTMAGHLRRVYWLTDQAIAPTTAPTSRGHGK